MSAGTYVQRLPWRVSVRRWWASGTQWTFIAGVVGNASTVGLDHLGIIGLQGAPLLLAILVGNSALYVIGAVLHYQSTVIIGTAHDIAKTEDGGRDAPL
jgi:hypothetical protein